MVNQVIGGTAEKAEWQNSERGLKAESIEQRAEGLSGDRLSLIHYIRSLRIEKSNKARFSGSW